MFPTAHDITEQNIDEGLAVLSRMLAAGNELLIVSKPSLACIKRLCTDLDTYKEQMVFRFSIGSADNDALRFWEPGAPSFKERLACLQYAYAMEFQTSVSGEPMLDGDPDALIAAVHPYVTDAIWLGKINRLRQILPCNCPRDKEAVRLGEALVKLQSDKAMLALYARYHHNSKIKWKDSIKAVVGLRRPATAGLDL